MKTWKNWKNHIWFTENSQDSSESSMNYSPSCPLCNFSTILKWGNWQGMIHAYSSSQIKMYNCFNITQISFFPSIYRYARYSCHYPWLLVTPTNLCWILKSCINAACGLLQLAFKASAHKVNNCWSEATTTEWDKIYTTTYINLDRGNYDPKHVNNHKN